jgi:hypothetical protein
MSKCVAIQYESYANKGCNRQAKYERPTSAHAALAAVAHDPQYGLKKESEQRTQKVNVRVDSCVRAEEKKRTIIKCKRKIK